MLKSKHVKDQNNKLFYIYKLLYKSFGPQHWWPAKSPFEVIVGAILTQNTNWKNVEMAIINLKSKGMLSAKAINNASSGEIEKLIRQSGYFRQKTKKLKIFCKYFIENYDGDINHFFNIKKPSLLRKRNELLSLHGIGKETADSILLYAGNKKIFVVDAYTRRLLERLGYGNIKDYDEIRAIFEKSIPKKLSVYKEFHALIVELAKRYCFKKKPNCAECPLDKKCKKMM